MVTGEQPVEPSTALIHSSLDRAAEAVFARGQFGDLFDAYLTHAALIADLPSETALGLMRQALACGALQLALLPPDQFVAWTLNVAKPTLNLFLAGDNGRFQITGRIYSEDVQTAQTNRLYVETQRPKNEPTRSMLDFEGLDLLRIIELYFRRSVQVPTRFFELAPDDFVMIQGLPRVDVAWLDGLTESTAAKHLDQPLEAIEERTYSFGCGCDPQKMLMVVRSMFADKPDELFQGEDQVEATCPRCGRAWVITRQEFDARNGELGFS